MAGTDTPREVLSATAAGFLGGSLGLGLEALAARPGALSPWHLDAWLSYGVGAGVLTALARWLAPRFGIPVAGATAAAAASPLLLWGLHAVNVRLLSGVPASTPLSLGADLVVLAAYLAVLLLLGARVRCGRAVLAAAAAAGALLLGVCVLLLAARWPRSAVAVQRGGRGPSLVLIVLDGVRRDHVGLHGYQRATTPRLDALAHASRVYERAYSGSSWTAPSVDRLLNPVPGGPSLAARLSAAGYATACFTDNPHLGPGAELVRDFDLVRRSVGGWRRLLRGTLAGSVIERLLPGDDARLASVVQDFLASAPRPTFLYVHLMDAHAPFDAPPIDRKARPGRRILHPSASLHMDAEEAESVIARYDGGIREADRAAGRILSAVLRPQADVVVVVTADHGVRLGENGNWGHGGAPVPQVIGVPLLVAGQGVVTGRVQRAVGADSIPRTLLSAAGVPCVECSGTDLRWSEGDGVVAGAAPPNYRFVIADGYKLIADRRGPRRLYDLHADPLERSDLAAARPEVLDRLAAMLPPDRGVPDPSPDDLERLRALGYVR